MFCDAVRDTLYFPLQRGVFELPWHVRTPEDYASAVDACEVRVTVRSRQVLRRLTAALVWDKRMKKPCFHGRALLNNFAELELLKGDRLEPTEDTLLDVGSLSADTPLPVELVFWRTTAETLATHRNPLFDARLGVGPNALAIDVLHTLLLGVVQRYVLRVIWLFVQMDAYQTGARTKDERHRMTVMHMKSLLFLFYGTYERAHPGVQMSKLNNLTPKMIGTEKKPKLKAKADETKWLLIFVMDQLETLRLPGDLAGDLLAAGKALQHYMDLMRENDFILSPSVWKAKHDTQANKQTNNQTNKQASKQASKR